MCSSRCDMPAWASLSAAEPVAIQKPSATERTAGTRSVTTRTPLSSVVMTCASLNCGRGSARAVARATRAAGAAVAGPPVAAAAVARTSVAVARSPRAVAAPAAAEQRELLDRLADDLGVVRAAHADAPALAVDLDDADRDLVALAEHLLDRLDPVARRDVGDVQQAVGALGELDERTEGGRLDDLAEELVADLDLLHHRADALDERVGELAVGRVDQHLAVVVDVDLRLVLLAQAADRLAALADQQADLARVDLDLLDPRCVDAERLAGSADHIGHLAEDEMARLVGLRQRVSQDVERDARDLDVHLQGG